MTDKLNAAKAIRNLASLYRHMEDAAVALEQIGSLEQAAAEAKRATDNERALLQTVQGDVEQAQAQLQSIRELATSTKETLEAEAEVKRVAAVDNANRIIGEAKDKAREIKLDAERRALSVVAEAEERKQTVEANLATLHGNLEEMVARVNQVREELRTLEAARAEAREQLTKLLG